MVLGMNLHNCEELACSEIRAAKVAECAREYPWSRLGCSKRVAERSTQYVLGGQGVGGHGFAHSIHTHARSLSVGLPPPPPP